MKVITLIVYPKSTAEVKMTIHSFYKMMVLNTNTEFRILGAEEHCIGHPNLWTREFWQKIQYYLTKNKNTLDILSCCTADYGVEYLPPIKVHPWPTYWITRSYYEFTRQDLEGERHYYNKQSINQPISILYINMNRSPRSHRCYMLDTLKLRGMFDQGDISWKTLTDYKWKYWTEKVIDIDDFFEFHTGFYDQWRCPQVYGRSLIDLVSETTKNEIFITEKTCRPLFFKKPFISFGAKGFHQNLKKLGFELYDEIVDYSFDDAPSWAVRCNMIVKEIEKIGNRGNLTEERKKVIDKIEYNHRRFCEIATDRGLIPDFVFKDQRHDYLLSECVKDRVVSADIFQLTDMGRSLTADDFK